LRTAPPPCTQNPFSSFCSLVRAQRNSHGVSRACTCAYPACPQRRYSSSSMVLPSCQRGKSGSRISSFHSGASDSNRGSSTTAQPRGLQPSCSSPRPIRRSRTRALTGPPWALCAHAGTGRSFQSLRARVRRSPGVRAALHCMQRSAASRGSRGCALRALTGRASAAAGRGPCSRWRRARRRSPSAPRAGPRRRRHAAQVRRRAPLCPSHPRRMPARRCRGSAQPAPP